MINERIEIDEEKEANYRRLVGSETMDELKEKILHELIVRKKYKDAGYTARQLAADIGTNLRYISAVIRVRFHTNYASFVNKLRVEESMSMLTDSRYHQLSIEEIGEMAGFVHRQSFHTAFMKFAGMTPKAYRMQYIQQLNPNKKQNRRNES
jgi:YesN/AraC family two-component response regulator